MGKNSKKIMKEIVGKNKEKEEERKAKIKAFFNAYTMLCSDHGVQVDTTLEINKRGVTAKASVMLHYNKESKPKNKQLLALNLAFFRLLVSVKKKKFLNEYRELCEVHKLQLNPIMEINDNGISPRITLANYTPAETKEWAECEKENEEWDKEAEQDRTSLSEAEFKNKWPDREYSKPE